MKIPASVKVAFASLGLGGAIGLTVALLLVGGECSAWRQDHPKPPKPTPQVLAPTDAEREMERVIEECLAIETLAPTPAERKRIAKESGRPEFATPPAVQGTNAPQPVPAGQAGEIVPPAASGGAREPDFPVLLAEKEVPPMPDGGKLFAWLEMDKSLTFVTKAYDPKLSPPDRFFEFRTIYEAGALYGIGADKEMRGRGWFAAEPIRLGRFRVRGEVGIDIRGGEQSSYALAGLVWRSR